MLGITGAAVSAWEIGKNQPDFAMLQRIATIFGVTVDYLLGRTAISSERKRTNLTVDNPGLAEGPGSEGPRSSSLSNGDDDELYVVFRGKRQELSPEYKRLLILMMEDANRKLREEQEKKK